MRRLLAAALGLGTLTAALSAGAAAAPPTSMQPVAAVQQQPQRQPLAGLTIALDPGHQLGNSRFRRQINRPVDAGGFRKACNTTGTATDSGVPEATVTWNLANAVNARLTALGAKVVMTRTANSRSLWGPCVDARGRFGAQQRANLAVSLHADGSSSRNRGFHVITPKSRAPWTNDIAQPSMALSLAVRDAFTSAGIPRSSYIGRGTALSVRSDLGTLNLSDVPITMIEIGNMRNATDARRMTTAAGLAQYADAVVAGVRSYLKR